MRLGNVRPYGRFVFDDRGGVWKRTAWTKAKCIYGKEYGMEIDVDPNVSVYAIFDNPENKFRRNQERGGEEEGAEPKGRMTEPTTVPPPESPNGQNPDTVPCPKCGVIGKPGNCQVCSATPVASSREIKEGPTGEGIVVEKGNPKPTSVSASEGMKIILMDDDEKVLAEICNCSSAQAVALTCSDGAKVRLPGKGSIEMMRDESFYDVEKNELYVVLRE